MRLIQAVAEQRRKHIESHALPYLGDGESVERWVRARHPKKRSDGFAYATARRLIVVVGAADHRFSVEWPEISAWGVDRSASGGPVLGFELPGNRYVLRLPVRSSESAQNVGDFLDLFAHRATRAKPHLDDEELELVAHRGGVIPVVRRTIADQTKRVLVTLIGILLVVGGALLTPLPGPWSFPIVLGGLAILGSEYDWAKDTLEWLKAKYTATKNRIMGRRSPT